MIDRHKELFSLLADSPLRSQSITVEKISEKQFDHYIRGNFKLNFDGAHSTLAYFIRPINAKCHINIFI